MIKKKLLSLLAAAAFVCGSTGCQSETYMEQINTEQNARETPYVTAAALAADQKIKTAKKDETAKNDLQNEYVFLGDKKYARNTESLVINDTELTGPDLENIVYFDDLKSLTLNICNEGSEAEFPLDLLASLKKVERLYISGYCSDLSFVSGMDSLKSIDLAEVYSLKNFDKLGQNNTVTELTVTSCPIENIDGITALPDLEAFTVDSVHHDGYIDLECLSRMKKIKKLCLKWLNIGSVDFIDNLNDLEELFIWLDNTDVSDYEKIGNCRNLKQLHLINVDMADLDFLKNISDLTYLEMRWGQISDISALNELKGLQGLEIWGIAYDDILCKLSGLQKLTIYETDLTDEQINKLTDSLSECEIKY